MLAYRSESLLRLKVMIDLLLFVCLRAGSLSVLCRGPDGTVEAAGLSMAKKSFAIILMHFLGNSKFEHWQPHPPVEMEFETFIKV